MDVKSCAYVSVFSRQPIGFDGVLKGLSGFDFNRMMKIGNEGGWPSSSSSMCFQPARISSSHPDRLPSVATVYWHDPAAVRTDCTKVQYS
jgi:hypothetical protein